MKVTFYTFTGDDRVINKSLGDAIGEKECTVQDACSILAPRLTLNYDGSLVSCNYIYIGTWGRYYKITDITVDEGGRMYVSAIVDAGLSWWSQVSSCTASVSRSEQTGVGNIIDNQLPINPTEESTYVETIPGAPAKGLTYILTLK